jgi:membrane protein DedA with SNARE-associated domain
MPIPPSLSGWRTIASSVVRTFISLPAGIARMNQVRFHLYTFIGSWPWCYVLAYIGTELGDKRNTDHVSRISSTASTSALKWVIVAAFHLVCRLPLEESNTHRSSIAI